MKATLIAATAPRLSHPTETRFLTAEELIVYCARVSNPSNQGNVETGERLLRYCMKHGHWSIFEVSSLTVEVETSRAIAAQILRHRSFTFQEFSQRYATTDQLGEDLFEPVEIRVRNPGGNRQGSVVPEEPVMITENTRAESSISRALMRCEFEYRNLLAANVAPEVARMVLPLCTKTRLYVTGSARSWIHYFQQRCSPHAQKEHRLLAEKIRDDCFKPVFPIIHQMITEAAV